MHAFDELRTPRLLLRRPQASDIDALADFNQNPQTMATLGGTRSREETQGFLARQLQHWDDYGFGWWVIDETQTGQFTGRGGLHHVRIAGRLEVEVGYGFLPQFWQRGFATELARESVRVAFAELGLDELVSFTLTTNRASRHVMEKVGFTYERDVVHADLPHVLYRLRASAWHSGGRV